MRRIFKVNPRDRKVYLGKDLEAEGYCTTGELEGFPNAFTVTLLKPGASLQQAITSLKTVIQDMEARKEDNEKRELLDKGKTKPGNNRDEPRQMLKGR